MLTPNHAVRGEVRDQAIETVAAMDRVFAMPQGQFQIGRPL
jgi:hypothetical protein